MAYLQDAGNRKMEELSKACDRLPREAFENIETFSLTWKRIVSDWRTGDYVLVPQVHVKYKDK